MHDLLPPNELVTHLSSSHILSRPQEVTISRLDMKNTLSQKSCSETETEPRETPSFWSAPAPKVLHSSLDLAFYS